MMTYSVFRVRVGQKLHGRSLLLPINFVFLSSEQSLSSFSSQPETEHLRNMLDTWILLFPLLLAAGAKAFMIHNTQHSLCLEDSAATGEVLLKKCHLDSESQQWIWIDQGMLKCVASSRCLSAMQTEPLRTQACQGPKVDAARLMWDCDRDRLISRNTSMLLSIDGRHLILTHDSKLSKWRSLDKGDICQEKLSKSVRITGYIITVQFVEAGTESCLDQLHKYKCLIFC
ncbi:uncharacterized protein LOC118337892 [Morone saxatilis]|uniref:uncharacterized protein LOC118337892 n=1 Tax=Morone saxatilis TaxID=34816 RepID=UPI0015E24C2E|nr:uncharacterized protein LOC118337892 [Morone saxatilis]